MSRGLVLDGRQLRGVVVLSATAGRTPAGWSAGTLLNGLTEAARSRPRLRVRELRCADAVAALVD